MKFILTDICGQQTLRRLSRVPAEAHLAIVAQLAPDFFHFRQHGGYKCRLGDQWGLLAELDPGSLSCLFMQVTLQIVSPCVVKTQGLNCRGA